MSDVNPILLIDQLKVGQILREFSKVLKHPPNCNQTKYAALLPWKITQHVATKFKRKVAGYKGFIKPFS